MFEFIHTAHAAVTLPYINPDDNLGQLIVSIYNYAIAIVGAAVFIQFIHAGLLYLLSAGSITKNNKAKEIMTNAITGAILLLSAYLILNVINPDLTNVNFDLDAIRKQMGDYSTKPVASQNINPKAKTTTVPTQKINIDLGNTGITKGNVNLDGMTQFTLGQLTAMAKICECGSSMTITAFSHSNFGDRVDISFNNKAAQQNFMLDYINYNARLISGDGHDFGYNPIPGSLYLTKDNVSLQYNGNNNWTFRFPIA